MLKFLSKLHFLINFVIKLYNLIPLPIYHNLERIKAYRKIFFLVNFERVEGDYLEFGVYEGSSLITAYKVHQSSSKQDGLVNLKKPIDRKFIGFDSFEGGFKYYDKNDSHENCVEGHLKSSFLKPQKRLKKISKESFFLINGFVEETLPSITRNNYTIGDYKLTKIAVVLIDMDLKNPAIEALNFCKEKLQVGSIIVIDNYFNYKTQADKGEFAAINNFFKNNNIKYTDFGNYGLTGKIFIISNIS